MGEFDTRLDRRWLFGCLAVATALRAFRIGHQSLWIDELISLQLATWADGPEFWRGLLVDIHGPFTSILLHGWATFGLEEGWLRLLYLLPGVATIPFVQRLATDLYGPGPGKGAALLLAVSPFHVWYSQEVRNYSWLLLWATIALVLFVRVWDGRSRRRDWFFLAGVLVLAVLTNFSAAFLLVTLSVLVVARRPFPRGLFVRWAGVLAFVGLVFLPWFLDWYTRIGGDRMFVSGSSPLGLPLREQAGFSLKEVPYALWSFTYGYSLGPSLRSLHLDRTATTLLPHLPVIGLGFLAPAIPLLAGIRGSRARERALLTGGLLAIPLLLSIFLAARGIKTFHPRYLMAAFPVYLAVLTFGWSQGGRFVRGAAGLALALAIVALGQHYFDPAYAKEDCRGAAEIVRAHEEPGDSVVVIYAFRPFRHYFSDTEDGRAQLFHVHKQFLRTDEQMRDHVTDARETGGRVWLVLTRWWDVAPETRIRAIFEETLDEKALWERPGVKVLLYEEKAA